MSNTPASNTLMSDTAIEKAALTITKLEGHENWICWSANIEMVLDHTWEFIKGGRTSPLQEDSPDFADWSNGNCAAHCRIWLALSDKVQDTVFCHLKSSATTLFKALKNQYEQSGTSVEFYATKTYNNAVGRITVPSINCLGSPVWRLSTCLESGIIFNIHFIMQNPSKILLKLKLENSKVLQITS